MLKKYLSFSLVVFNVALAVVVKVRVEIIVQIDFWIHSGDDGLQSRLSRLLLCTAERTDSRGFLHEQILRGLAVLEQKLLEFCVIFDVYLQEFLQLVNWTLIMLKYPQNLG
jgi:hypothetical protein